jgi:hypothetical protein
LVREKYQDQVDAFDLAEPLLRLGALTSGDKIGLQLGQSRQHLGVDLEHRTAEAGVLVLAASAVRASAVAQLQLPLVEVLLEFLPLRGSDIGVLGLEPHPAAG